MVNVREKLVKGVLENYRVDLVLSGHSHTYERSRPMREHYGVANTFVPSFDAPAANNGLSSGSYDGSPGNPTGGSCFYYKSAADPKNHIVYIVNGSGGGIEGIQSPCDPTNQTGPCWPHKAMQTSLNVSGSMYIEVEQDRLDAKFIDENGDVKDQFTIMKDLKSFTVPPTDGTIRKATCECTDAEGWTHYTDLKASLLLSIKKKGATIGTVGDGTFNLQLAGAPGTSFIKANYPTNYVRATLPSNIWGTWATMNRYWSLTPTTELSGNSQVVVRHYFNEADKVSVQVDGVGPAIAYKINNGTGTYNPDPASGHAAIPKATAYNKSGAWTYDYGDMQTGIGSWYTRYGYDVPNLAYWINKWDQDRSASSIATWKSRYMGKGSYWGEMVIGRLKGGGGIGTYNRYANPTGSQSVLLTGSHWTYFAKGVAPAANWNGTTPTAVFNEADWAKDPDDGPGLVSPFGYSPNYEDGERTRVPACAQEPCSTKWWTVYFRSGFLLNDVPSYYNYKYYIINYKRDDGIIIYINGKELRRDNMPAGTIYYNTPASTAVADEADWQTIIIPNDGQFIRTGQNIIAAEVHQVADANGQATSSDMHFDLEIIRTADLVSSTARIAVEQVSRPDEYKVEAYPNPTRDGNVSFSPALPYHSYILTDVQGRVLKQVTAAGMLERLDLSGQQPGIYILVSQGEYGTKWFKLVRN